MGNVKKDMRVQDVDIRRLNHMGLGLRAIADMLGCHAATITLRLKAMGIDPTDTRRSFMEEVFKSLPENQRDWLSHNLFNKGISVKTFISQLIGEAYELSDKETSISATPVPMPEMQGGGADVPLESPVSLHPPTSDLTAGEYEVGGVSEKPTPDQMVEPERLEEQPVEPPKTVPSKPKKLNFK